MYMTIEIGGTLEAAARQAAKARGRSMPEQVEHWANIGRVAEDNPDLTYGAVLQALAATRNADKVARATFVDSPLIASSPKNDTRR